VKERFQEIGSKIKKRVTVNNTEDKWGHILAGDILSPTTTMPVVKLVLDFYRFVEKEEQQ
jgi:hypothetical protein